MLSKIASLGSLVFVLTACAGFPAEGPVIDTGNYDWTDQVRDAQGFPLPGWGDVIAPEGGGNSM
jgi:hypothetical protein